MKHKNVTVCDSNDVRDNIVAIIMVRENGISCEMTSFEEHDLSYVIKKLKGLVEDLEEIDSQG